jgi:hypothetical protein
MIIFSCLKKEIISKSLLYFLFIGILCHSGFAQEMSKKALKEKEQDEKRKATLTLIESKTFTFEGQTAITDRGRSINLMGNPNYFKIMPDIIESSMPFFGRVTGAASYGDNGGLDFKGKPKNLVIEKAKNKYKLNVEVKASPDSYRIYMEIGLEGGATLSISSNNRSTMTYYGEISELK